MADLNRIGPSSGNTDQLLLHYLHDIQLRHSRHLGRCQLCGIVGHFALQCGYLSTSALATLPLAPTWVSCSTFTTPYAHIAVHYSNPNNSSDWVIDSGASHHVTTDLATLDLYESYIASGHVLIGDGTGLSITNTSSFTLTSLSIPLLFTNVLHVLAMSKNLMSISSLYADNPINVLFFYPFFQV